MEEAYPPHLPQVGNQVPRYSGWKLYASSVSIARYISFETKYRDIADGNVME